MKLLRWFVPSNYLPKLIIFYIIVLYQMCIYSATFFVPNQFGCEMTGTLSYALKIAERK